MPSPPTTKPELKAYLLATLPGVVPDLVEMHWADSCDGDEGCGGLLVVRVGRDYAESEYMRDFTLIQDHMPEALADDSLPHCHVVYDDEAFEPTEYVHLGGRLERVYTVKETP